MTLGHVTAMDLDTIKSKFIDRVGFYGQPYKSLRLKECEITIDALFSPCRYQLSVCTPYNERLDNILRVVGIGAGEVTECWYFGSEEEMFDFIIKSNMVK